MNKYIDRNGKALSNEVCTAYDDYETRIKLLKFEISNMEKAFLELNEKYRLMKASLEHGEHKVSIFNCGYVRALPETIKYLRDMERENKAKDAEIERLNALFDNNPTHWSNVIYNKNQELETKDALIKNLLEVVESLVEDNLYDFYGNCVGTEKARAILESEEVKKFKANTL